ncbi:MAG: DUF4012 domain-containing protein [Candidatus Komeilibacteria bacterium]|nr:DUF4012 domain-containing protein [Candidatus Komeilibacteria bacterium]
MPTKKKIKTPENFPIARRKKPQDDNHHLAVSLTRHAQPHDDYSSLVNKRGFKHSQARHEAELADAARREGFWRVLEEEIENKVEPIISDQSGFIKIKKTPHQRSPFILRLTPATPAPATTAPDWVAEVERLRREAISRCQNNKNKTSKINVNFLTRRAFKPKKRRAQINQPLLYGKIKKAPAAVIVWLFEFILSIPLGFLLLLHGLLILAEKLNKLLIKSGRALGRGFVFVVEETFLGLLALLRGALMIPLKLASLGLLAIYRLISMAGSWVSRGFMSIANALSLVGKQIKKSPRKTLTKVLAMAGIAALVIAPIKFLSSAAGDIRLLRGRVLGEAREGFNLLSQGQAEAASRSLVEAQSSLNSVSVIVRGLIKLTPQGQDGENLIIAGQELATGGEFISVGLAPFINKSTGTGDVITAIKNLSGSLSLAAPHIYAAQQRLDKIDSDIIPAPERDKFLAAQALLPKVAAAMSDLGQLSDSLVEILGGNREKRYAVLFQNNNELRPAGGFIGSLALVRLANGRITKIDIPGGGSYDFKGFLTKHVLAPKPLALINPHWQLQDANWYPDWPTSAEKVAWFLESSGESSVDGVIALQATTLQDLLRILGPIDFPDEKVVLSAENVIQEIQTAVELKYDKTENQPKKYIAELAPRVLDKILASTSGQFLDLFGLIQEEIAEKNVLLYFRDQDINSQFLNRGWEPSVLSSQLDYLSIVHANIGGGKTDGVIEEVWDQQITIDEDGSAVAELAISRFHKGDPNDQFEKANNVDYVRVYVPAGSEFISGSGFKPPAADLFESAEDYYTPDEQLTAIEGQVLVDEATGTRITQEFGKTAFGNWMQVKPGKTSMATFKYKLPFKIKPGGYSLLIQKQAGARPIDYTISISYPEFWKIAWKKVVGEGTINDNEAGKILLSGILSKDAGFGALFTE